MAVLNWASGDHVLSLCEQQPEHPLDPQLAGISGTRLTSAAPVRFSGVTPVPDCSQGTAHMADIIAGRY